LKAALPIDREGGFLYAQRFLTDIAVMQEKANELWHRATCGILSV